MVVDTKQDWIIAGYKLFSMEGSKGLKIEVLARQVKKSKSSFYHHFADLETFITILLKFHLQRAKIIADRETLCKNIDPDLINILVDVKQDLLFNRQLRVNRSNVDFKKCFEKSNKLVESAFLDVWVKDLGFLNKEKLASVLFGLVLENFYLQLTDETTNHQWLQDYFKNVKNMIIEFNKQ